MSARLLTIVVEVDQPAANWLWELHMDGKARHGITAVRVLHDGNVFTDKDELERHIEELDYVHDRQPHQS